MIDLIVRDNGAGIPADKLPRIFESFLFDKRRDLTLVARGARGLGFRCGRDIIEAHHGRIRVESTVGRGTAFTLRLPVAKEPAKRTPSAVPAMSMPAGATVQSPTASR